MVADENSGTPPANNGENATIRQMREHIESLEKSLKTEKGSAEAIQKELDDLKKGQLSEQERIATELKEAQAKLSELTSTASKATELEQAVENVYNSMLNSVPEDKRELVKAVTSTGTWPERLKALENAMKLASIPAPGGGTITQPVNGTPPAGSPDPNTPNAEPKQLDPKTISWKDALKPASAYKKVSVSVEADKK